MTLHYAPNHALMVGWAGAMGGGGVSMHVETHRSGK
jgi:hypothetical protein